VLVRRLARDVARPGGVAHDENIGCRDSWRVSSSDSPLCRRDGDVQVMTSADSRLAAISKVVRVRVEGSKTG
jgi:hypothetical protein